MVLLLDVDPRNTSTAVANLVKIFTNLFLFPLSHYGWLGRDLLEVHKSTTVLVVGWYYSHIVPTQWMTDKRSFQTKLAKLTFLRQY